jgi:hypothetical protein
MQTQWNGEPHTTNQYFSHVLGYSILFFDHVYTSFLVSVDALVSRSDSLSKAIDGEVNLMGTLDTIALEMAENAHRNAKSSRLTRNQE